MYPADSLPPELERTAQAAVTWLNEQQGSAFYLTGVQEPNGDTSEDFELGLILCDGDICTRETVSVSNTNGGVEFARVDDDAPAIPPLLDPPPGLRRAWLDEQLQRYDFLLLLFYRGRW